MVEASPLMKKYLESLDNEILTEIALANEARGKGLDPADNVEVAPARDVAARVEGLVGPVGVADRIRELTLELKDREKVCFEICKEIMQGKFGEKENEALIEQAVRSGLALFTEGVVSAPIEGVSKVKIRKNSDGSSYVTVYFTGPIRGAGGTGQAFTLLLADYCRKFFGLSPYLALEDEKNRFVEELNLYAAKTRAGQYVPTEEEVKHVITNCPVCVNGEPTEDYEVNTYKNLAAVETNKVRSGVCLVISEGVCLKASKVMKIAKKAGLDWSWLDKLVKVSKQTEKKVEIKPVGKYMDEIVAGRPIFSFPMSPGGFRLRYGRSRFCGILSKGIHPATMIILDDFPVFGTQVKTERPGKGCIVTPCETIDGPIVLLNNGSVKQIFSVEEALELKEAVKEILFLGDMLACYGDFNKSNHPIVQSAWCEEWFQKELEDKGVKKTIDEIKQLSFNEAFELTKSGVALAPRYTFYWHDLTVQEIRKLAEFLVAKGKLEYEWFDLKSFSLENSEEKRLLELIGLQHQLSKDNEIIIEKNDCLALLQTLGLIDGKALSLKKLNALYSEEKTTMQLLNELAPFQVKKKAGIYIGSSMGRPEKSKERKMQPPVNSLFPIGHAGGNTRDMIKAINAGVIEVEVEARECASCGKIQWTRKCECSGETQAIELCSKCGKKQCACNAKKSKSSLQRINLKDLVEKASARVQSKPDKVKAVIGLISGTKTPEAVEKGLLRAKHDLSVFRDGTIRHDSTEIPLTHFIPSEIGLSVEKALELGYEKDCYGKPIESEDQVIELFPQDIVVSEHAIEYFYRVTQFIDDELVYLYGLHAFFNCSKPSDLIGKTFVAIAPHTSAGIACRLIGFAHVQGLLAHPYLHCACRRNADGDELAIMLAMDLFLNFSLKFLPETRGGKMDAALVLTTMLDPREVDDEVHAMDRAFEYPLEFYRNSENNASPSEAKIHVIGDDLGTAAQYEGIGFTHHASILGPIVSKYVTLESMAEKVEVELELMKKIRAVDESKASEKIILSHFLPDLYGNLRSFGRQKIRCVECSAKYRRVPLSGKCRKCGGKLLLTINKGGIIKYLSISKAMIEKYALPDYLKQRLMLLEREINEIFKEEDTKQFSLAKYF